MGIQSFFVSKGGNLPDEDRYIEWLYISPETGSWESEKTARYDYLPPPYGNVPAVYSNGTLKCPALNLQRWNIGEAEALENFSHADIVKIGATYIPSDGKTYVKVKKTETTGTLISIYVTITGSGTLTFRNIDGTSFGSRSNSGSVTWDNGKLGVDWFTVEFQGTGSWSPGQGTSSTVFVGGSVSAQQHIISAAFLGPGITKISDFAFAWAKGLESVTIPSGVTVIGTQSLYACPNLDFQVFPSGVSSVGNSCFESCFILNKISLPASLTSLGSQTFQGCFSVDALAVPSRVTALGTNIFWACYAMKKIYLPSGMTSIGGSAFYSCSALENPRIPSTVISIGENAFYSCRAIQKIYVPSGVATLGDGAFNNCQAVLSYTFLRATPPTNSGVNTFGSITSQTRIYVPKGSLSAYRSATNWTTVANYMLEDTADNRALYGD